MNPTYDMDTFHDERLRLLWLPMDLTGKNQGVIPTAVATPVNLETGAELVLVYLHGNGEDIGCSLSLLLRLADTLNAVVFAPEYPGYGIASGQPSSDSIDATARAVTTAICSRLQVPPERLVVFGRSIGTGPAAELAAWLNSPSLGTGVRQPACMLLLHSPYTSLRDMARSIAGPAGGLMLQRWNTAEVLKSVGCPVLILHARMDDVIPYQQAQQLHAQRHLYGATCELHTQSDGADHNTFSVEADVIRPVRDFFCRNVKARTTSSHNPFDRERVAATCALMMRWGDITPPFSGCKIGLATSSSFQRAMSGVGAALMGSVALSAAAVSGSLAATGRATASEAIDKARPHLAPTHLASQERDATSKDESRSGDLISFD